LVSSPKTTDLLAKSSIALFNRIYNDNNNNNNNNNNEQTQQQQLQEFLNRFTEIVNILKSTKPKELHRFIQSYLFALCKRIFDDGLVHQHFEQKALDLLLQADLIDKNSNLLQSISQLTVSEDFNSRFKSKNGNFF